MSRSRWAQGLTSLWLAALCGSLAGCSSTGNGSVAQRAEQRPSAPSSADVASASAWVSANEVKGKIDIGSLWALFPGRDAQKEDKTIWRMTGSGPFKVYAVGPGGRTIKPLFSPAYHYGSSWHRPGEEWGVFWKVPNPGTWTFHASRGGVSGRLSVTFH